MRRLRPSAIEADPSDLLRSYCGAPDSARASPDPSVATCASLGALPLLPVKGEPEIASDGFPPLALRY